MGYKDEDLRERQRRHLEEVNRRFDNRGHSCLHDGCPECIGTGIRRNGSMCVHSISCPCPKCTPMCMSTI